MQEVVLQEVAEETEKLRLVILNEVKSGPKAWPDIQHDIRARSRYWILRCAQDDRAETVQSALENFARLSSLDCSGLRKN